MGAYYNAFLLAYHHHMHGLMFWGSEWKPYMLCKDEHEFWFHYLIA